MANSHHFLRKYLRDVIADQHPDGAIAYVSPDNTHLRLAAAVAGATVPIMFTAMTGTPFDLDTRLGQRRAIIRRDGGGVEMVEAAWGLQPGPRSNRPFALVRADGRTFPTHRCLVPASEFRLRSCGRAYSLSLADDDWFYFAFHMLPQSKGAFDG